MLLLALVGARHAGGLRARGRGRLPVGQRGVVKYDSKVEHLSLAVAIVLILSYVGGLIFSLRTHRDLFNPPYEQDAAGWSVRRGVIALAIAGVLVGVMSEVLVGSISEAAESIGLSEFFIGAIVVAIVGNAAEHWVAVLVAAKNKMDLAVNIAIGSSAQIALFVAPVLVLLSFVFGDRPMPLVFNGFELAAVMLAVLIAEPRHRRRRVELVRGSAAAGGLRDRGAGVRFAYAFPELRSSRSRIPELRGSPHKSRLRGSAPLVLPANLLVVGLVVRLFLQLVRGEADAARVAGVVVRLEGEQQLVAAFLVDRDLVRDATQSAPSKSSMLKISPSISAESSTTISTSVCGLK